MASTGEVACLGRDLPEAFLKAILSAGFKMPVRREILLSIGSDRDKVRFLPSARTLRDLGFTLYATRRTSGFLKEHGVPNVRLYKIQERRKPSLLDYIVPSRLDLIINIPLGYDRRELTDGYIIRRRAIDFGIPLITNVQLAELFVKSIATRGTEALGIEPYDAYVASTASEAHRGTAAQRGSRSRRRFQSAPDAHAARRGIVRRTPPQAVLA
jgi:hypothetical protein